MTGLGARALAASLAERGREGARRWRENGFSSLSAREKAIAVLAAVVVLVMVASLLVATVSAVAAPGEKTDGGAVRVDTREEVVAVAAAVTLARVTSSDPAVRAKGYRDDVDPAVAAKVVDSFDPGVQRVLESSGAGPGGTLSTQPMGYRLGMDDGRLAQVRLWARQDTEDASGGSARREYLVYEVLMRWSGSRWLMYAYVGREAGPAPEDPAATAYTALPTVPVEARG